MAGKLKYIAIMFLTALAFSSGNLFSQDEKDIENNMLTLKNPEGTEFWLCFMKNYKEPEARNPSNELLLQLFISGDKDANVNIESPAIGFQRKLFVPGGTVKSIMIDPLAQILSSEQIERNRAIHVTSDNPVSVYGLNRRFQTTDTYLGLPVWVLGTSYRAICYSEYNGLMPEFAVVATDDSTEVMIIPTVRTEKHEANKPFMVNLKKGDVYQVMAIYEPASKCDLTGTLIKANKKIAVFSGHVCACVPPRIIACNHLVEQMPPLPSWGKHFYIGMLKPRSQYTYRVLANEANTKVFEDTKLIKVLNQGEYLERNATKNLQITADRPILVAQYSQGYKNGDSIGDPMMLLISPTQQFLRKYRFSTPINGYWDHYINVVAPTLSIATMSLDGRTLDSNLFEPLGLSRYSIAYIKIPYGTHIIEGAMPFGMYSYGFGYDHDSFDAYGTMGGQSFLEYEPAKDTLPPMIEPVNENNQMRMIFRDDRVDDSGIKELKVLNSTGVNAAIPKIESGLPQLSIVLKPEASNQNGRIVMKISDVALNSVTFTVCYIFNPRTNKFEFMMNEGDNVDCSTDPGYQLGVFGKLSHIIHTANFSSSGNIHAEGNFTNTTGSGGYAGIIAARQFWKNVILSARLSLENYGGTLIAPDSSLKQIRDTATGTLKPSQMAYVMDMKGLFLHLSFAAEWYVLKQMYLVGGLNFGFTLSDAVDVKTRILMPEGFAFKDGSREKTPDGAPNSIGSTNFLRPGIFFGFGYSMPINGRINGFAEATYTNHLAGLISPGDWGIQQFSILAGIRVRM